MADNASKDIHSPNDDARRVQSERGYAPWSEEEPKSEGSGDLKAQIQRKLEKASELSTEEIEVQVMGGRVTLVGTVKTREEKYLAQELVSQVAGVEDTENQLTVKESAA